MKQETCTTAPTPRSSTRNTASKKKGYPTPKPGSHKRRNPKTPKKNLEEVKQIPEKDEWYTTKTAGGRIHTKSGALYSERHIPKPIHMQEHDQIRPSKEACK